ncbi:autotransporter outer membrane beta-barrel domain-containing protein [Pannonibacter phragmitetus]|uniref:autotransporter outer membrane beta-barrel domain-containing protein n=1 Tax=Pannonibacter phragmitetus TaxID=121719 RepID=UPI0013DD96F2|nr:autotransporter domain-containing protein [Pannonibacter phragmitetus]
MLLASTAAFCCILAEAQAQQIIEGALATVITTPVNYNTNLSVGRNSDGTLIIRDGGSISNTRGDIGDGDIGHPSGITGAVTVTGAGSAWTNSQSLFIGRVNNGTLTIENGGAVSSTNGFVGQFDGSTGAVTVTGAGSTWTNSDELYIGEDGTGTLTIAAGGSVSNVSGYIGDGIGSGLVTVSGADSNGNASSWTNSSTLDVGYYGTGTLTIADGGEVRVGAAGLDGKYNGAVNIASSDSEASGTLNIGAETGSSAAAAGKLNAASLVFGDGNGKLVFNHTNTDYDFSMSIARPSNAPGQGTIEHLAGSTKFSGDSSAFTGTTNVSGGTLYVTGSLGGTINALAGGTLAGTGTIGTGSSTITIGNGGRLSPGLDGSVGTLAMNGTLNLASGSTYVVQLSGNSSDAINLTGTVTIASGAALQVSGTATAQSYTILTASTLTGTFSTVDWGGVTAYEVAYNETNGTVSLVRAAGSPSSQQTPNQPSGASVLLSQTPSQSSVAFVMETGNAPAGLLSVVSGLAPDQQTGALQQLSGQSHADMNSGLVKINTSVNNTVNARVRAVTSGVAAPTVPVLGYGEEKKTVTDDRFAAFEKKEVPADPDRFAVWTNGFGSWGQAGATNGGSSTGMASAGILAGGDAIITGNLRAGVFGGFSRSYFDDSSSKGNSSNYHAGAYAGTSWDALSFRTGLSYTWYDVNTKRSISAVSETVEGKYNASSLNAFGEVSYRIETAHAAFEPFAGLSHTHMKTDGFTETGGISALTIGSSTSDTTYTTLGMRASTDVYLGPVTASLRGSLGWLYAFGDIDATRTARFATGSSFNVTGTPLDRNAALVETGADFRLSPSSTLGITYSGQFGKIAQEHGANAKLRVQF